MDKNIKHLIHPQLPFSSKMEEATYLDQKFMGMMVSFQNDYIVHTSVYFSKKWDTSLGKDWVKMSKESLDL